MGEGLVIVLFTDVESSTELSTRRGDIAARDLLRIHEELVRAQIAGHHGRVAGSRGDGFLVTFSSARRALTCAVAIQRALEEHAAWAPHEHVRVRIGLNAGEVAEEDGELYGAAVNAAARVCARARAGEILVASVVRQLAGTVPGMSFADRGRVRLRGFPEDTHLYQLIWRSRALDGGLGLPPTPLAGRDAEMTTLHELVEAALGGRGALVMLAGGPRVGKTRLAEEVVGEAARRGMLALVGHCHELAGSPPYAPFVEIIEAAARTVPAERFREALGDGAAGVARVAPELHRLVAHTPPVTPPDEHDQGFVLTCIRDFFERASQLRPLLLVLEDLQWADEATLALLCHLARRVPTVPVLILGTYRDLEMDAGHVLAGILEVLARGDRCHRIELRRVPGVEPSARVTAGTGQEPPDQVVAAVHNETERLLLTLLLTDIIGSTEQVEQLGDRRWQRLLDDHDNLVRQKLQFFNGREVKATGDGFLAAFDSPTAAVCCAEAIRDSVRRLGLEVRAGLHIGECALTGGEIRGLAVHITARVASTAGPGEIVVSSTVRDGSSGSGLRFVDRGPHELRGLKGSWRLYAVQRAADESLDQ